MESSAKKAKHIKRGEFRRDRLSLSTSSQEKAATALASRATEMALLLEAKAVAAYIACDGEIDPALLLARCAARGSRILLPRTKNDGGLEFAEQEPGADSLPTGPGGILEPAGPPLALNRLPRASVLLVPSVALARDGTRLGRGGGYYDRFIPSARSAGWWIVGVCHDRYLVTSLPCEDHDARVDACLTDKRLTGPQDIV